jgi:hypothetical protein
MSSPVHVRELTVDQISGMIEHAIAAVRTDSTASTLDFRTLLTQWFSAQLEQLDKKRKESAISFAEGKKIFDQGWNEGIDHFQRTLNVVVARSR